MMLRDLSHKEHPMSVFVNLFPPSIPPSSTLGFFFFFCQSLHRYTVGVVMVIIPWHIFFMPCVCVRLVSINYLNLVSAAWNRTCQTLEHKCLKKKKKKNRRLNIFWESCFVFAAKFLFLCGKSFSFRGAHLLDIMLHRGSSPSSLRLHSPLGQRRHLHPNGQHHRQLRRNSLRMNPQKSELTHQCVMSRVTV